MQKSPLKNIKRLSYILLLGFAIFMIMCGCDSKADYYGQTPPDDTAEIFAEGIISTDDYDEYPCSFTPDYQTMVFGGLNAKRERHLFISNRTDNGWTEPERINPTGMNEMEPVFSPNGKRLYFASESERRKGKPHTLYVSEYTNGMLSPPQKLPDTINSPYVEYYCSEADGGNLYFTQENKGLMVSRQVDGEYIEAELLAVPSGYSMVSHPYISPDESFILFDARSSNGYGSADIYIAFMNGQEIGEPINLGEKINSSDWDAMPMMSPDGKYLFFVRSDKAGRDIYWVRFDVGDYR